MALTAFQHRTVNVWVSVTRGCATRAWPSMSPTTAIVDTYDVIILDRDLPQLDGDAICRRIVGSPSTSRTFMPNAAALVENRM
jgi:DNA-binding response OmpR family regulator